MVAKEKHCQHNEDIVSPLPVGPLGWSTPKCETQCLGQTSVTAQNFS